MTGSIERRIEALEANEEQPWRCVWRHEGETVEHAIEREGIRPEERVYVFSWVENAL
jgi:hypothetical protein